MEDAKFAPNEWMLNNYGIVHSIRVYYIKENTFSFEI